MYEDKRVEIYRLFITKKNSVFINKFNYCGFSHDFIMSNDIELFENCHVKNLINAKKDMGITELYIELNKLETISFVDLERDSHIINSEDDLNINSFTRYFFTKNHVRKKTALNAEKEMDKLFKHLKLLDVIEAFNAIQLIRLKGYLNYSDFFELYSKYTDYLKNISKRYEENNYFYLTKMVLDLRSLKDLNIII